MKKLIFICTLLILTIVIVIPVAANDASMGRNGETVYPLEETDVRMVAEDIYVKYIAETGSGHVTCEFVFENSGEAKSVLMGFPAEEKIWSEALTTVERVRLRNFTANLNGIPIDVNEIEGEVTGEFEKYTSWYVFEVPFNAGESLTMTHEYDVSFTAYSTGQIQLSYILITGATWGGNIGHTKVTFDLTEMNPWGINMNYYSSINDFRYENGLLIFEKSDYTPDFNLDLMVAFISAKKYDDSSKLSEMDLRIKEDYKLDESTLEKKEFFDTAHGKSIEELINMYNNISTRNKFIETVYINTLHRNETEEQPPSILGLEFQAKKRFNAWISDVNFNMEKTAKFVMKYENGYTIYEGNLKPYRGFGDYGTLVYSININDDAVREIMVNDWVYSYDITISDQAGNTSTVTYTKDELVDGATMISAVSSDGDEVITVPNPKTSEAYNFSLMALFFIMTGLISIKYRNSKLRDTNRK